MRVAGGEAEPGIIGREVSQWCPLSTLLFSINAEMMIIKALENNEERIRVGGELIPDIRCADDQGMVPSSELGLQRLMDRLNATAKNYNTKLNVKRTKTMVVSGKGEGMVSIVVDGQ